MLTYLPAATRGLTQIGWLQSYHAFSFNTFHDASRHNFGPLRVLNDDIIQPVSGFGAHPHDNMEIVTYVLEGTLEHRDSSGGHGVIKENEVQRMTAGTGVVHSEYNNERDTRVRLLQIWIFPERYDLEPGYEQKLFAKRDRHATLLPIASSEPSGPALKIHQDATIYASSLPHGGTITHALKKGRGGYIYVIDGAVQVNGMALEQGDALEARDEEALTITALAPTEFVLFDLKMEGWEPV